MSLLYNWLLFHYEVFSKDDKAAWEWRPNLSFTFSGTENVRCNMCSQCMSYITNRMPTHTYTHAITTHHKYSLGIAAIISNPGSTIIYTPVSIFREKGSECVCVCVSVVCIHHHPITSLVSSFIWARFFFFPSFLSQDSRSEGCSPFSPTKLDAATKQPAAPVVRSISRSRGRDSDLCSGQVMRVVEKWGGGARFQLTCWQVDGGEDIVDRRYLICCLPMSHWDAWSLCAGWGGAAEVFVSRRLITSRSFSAGQGSASGGESDPARGKCLGSGYLWIPLKTEHPCSGPQVGGGGRRRGVVWSGTFLPSQAVFSGGLKKERWTSYRFKAAADRSLQAWRLDGDGADNHFSQDLFSSSYPPSEKKSLLKVSCKPQAFKISFLTS